MQQRQHISRFLKFLADRDLTRHLAMMDLSSVTALEDTLIALRRSAKQDRVPDPTPPRSKTPPATTPRRVNVGRTISSRCRGQRHRRTRSYDIGLRANALQGQRGARGASPRGSRGDPCGKCVSTLHQESRCCADIVCGLCNAKGHPRPSDAVVHAKRAASSMSEENAGWLLRRTSFGRGTNQRSTPDSAPRNARSCCKIRSLASLTGARTRRAIAPTMCHCICASEK